MLFACLVIIGGNHFKMYFHASGKKNRKQDILPGPLQCLQRGRLVSVVLHFHDLKEQRTHGYGCD